MEDKELEQNLIQTDTVNPDPKPNPKEKDV